MKSTNKFPDNFMWGASTSAFQVEGAAKEDGKGLSVADIISFKKRNDKMDTTVSVDHYHHYKEDVALMKELGLKSYRFSISWARIFPNGDDDFPNEKGVEFYNNLLDELIKNSIEPIVTMYHFDLPWSLVERYGGWESKKTIDAFEKYGKFLFEKFGDRVTYWLTINEQAVISGRPEMIGIEDSDRNKLYERAQQANYNMFIAQAKIFALCHSMLPQAKIGPAISYLTAFPETKNASDSLACRELENYISYLYMDVAVYGKIPKYYINILSERDVLLEISEEDKNTLLNGTADFLALNWYSSTVAKRGTKLNVFGLNIEMHNNDELEQTKWGLALDSEGFQYALEACYERYKKPIIISENGWSSEEKLIEGKIHDDMRIKYLNNHIYQMSNAISYGVEIISYNPWSFIDLLSVNDGMEKRYGLVFVDRDNRDAKQLKRYKKDSFYFYADIIKKNGEGLNMK